MGRFAWFSADLVRDRLRTGSRRLRESAAALSPAARWGLIGLAVVVLGLLGFVVAGVR